MQNTEEKRNNYKKAIAICSMLLFCLASLILYFGENLGLPDWNDVFECTGLRAETDDDLSVYFLSVGMADSIYIHQGETDILIDAGTDNSVADIDVFLKRYNCKGFDAVFVTHPDADHIGGMAELLDDYEVNKLYIYNYSDKLLPDTYECIEFQNSVKENNIQEVYISSKENENKITIGKLCFEVLSPDDEKKTINEMSLVLKMTYGEKTFLFAGDIGEKTENEIINKYPALDCDVLKVAHHGSKYSSSAEFLSAVTPEISVISAGTGSMYLPSYKAKARLAEFSDVYVTSADGNILIRSDGQIFDVQTKV